MGITIRAITDLPREVASLLLDARSVADNSYNRYSGFAVGATVVVESGARYSGCFLENASLGLTICAEPAAIMAANSDGHLDIRTIAIVGGDPSTPEEGPACTPCGRCRQILWELVAENGRDIEVYGANLAFSRILLTTAAELLPYPFGPEPTLE